MDPFRGERISKLAQHPAWPDLIAEVVQQEVDYWDTVTRRLRAGQELDPAEVEVKRAFFKGMKHVVAFPDLGAKAIQKHVEKEQVKRS